VLLAEGRRRSFRHLWLGVEEDGYEVVEAEDGLALLATIEETLTVRRERPDAFLVVADIRMPGLTGPTSSPSCAARTGHARDPAHRLRRRGTHAEGRELGVVAMFDKPST